MSVRGLAIGLTVLLVVSGSTVLLLTDLLGWADDGDPMGASGTDDGATGRSEPQRETHVDTIGPRASAGTEALDLVRYYHTILEEQPANFTGAIVEFTWSMAPQAPGVNNWSVRLMSGSSVLSQGVGAAQPIRLNVSDDAYTGGELRLSYDPHPGRLPVGAMAAGEITIYTTVFTHGPPDWSYSAVED